MSGIPPTIYSKEGIVICKFTMDGNFATGAIAHFYFTNVGSNGKSKFIVILNVTVGTYAEATKAKVVKLDLKKEICFPGYIWLLKIMSIITKIQVIRTEK